MHLNDFNTWSKILYRDNSLNWSWIRSFIFWLWPPSPPGQFWLSDVSYGGRERTLIPQSLKGCADSGLGRQSWRRTPAKKIFLTFRCWESCLRRLVVGWFLDVIQGWANIWFVVNLLLGFTSSMAVTVRVELSLVSVQQYQPKFLARFETDCQLPESMSYWPFPILCKMSSAESSGPVAKGVSPASMVNSNTPRLHTSQAAS